MHLDHTHTHLNPLPSLSIPTPLYKSLSHFSCGFFCCCFVLCSTEFTQGFPRKLECGDIGENMGDTPVATLQKTPPPPISTHSH